MLNWRAIATPMKGTTIIGGIRRPMPWLVTALVALAWGRRFVVDDAFISFRYAEHLAMGHGLVWNPGEHVEGYTNFLWTLLMTLPHVGVVRLACTRLAHLPPKPRARKRTHGKGKQP